jgi:hypothetical protein
VTTTFAVPRSLDRIRADSNRFSLLWVGRKAHANSEVTRPNITIPNQPDAAKRISAQQAH